MDKPIEDGARSVNDIDSIATRLKAVYDVLPVGITITDLEGHLIDVNAASESLLGIPREEHLRRNFADDWDIFDADGRRMRPEQFASVRALNEGSEVREQLMQVYRPDVSPIWLSVSALPVMKDGIGVVIAYTDVTELVHAGRRIEELALYDPLTGLPNRQVGLDRLQQMLRTAALRHERVAILQLNIDKLREINEAFGHSAGDSVLQEVAERLVENLNSDAVVSRLIGDEFLVAVPTPDPAMLADNLLRASMVPMPSLDGSGTVSTSAGVVVFPDDGVEPEELLRQADIATAQAKKKHALFQFYCEKMDQQIGSQVRLARALEQALAEDQLSLHFQPQFNLADGGLCGAEALLRWHDAELGWVPPSEFIPVAENRGMMAAVGTWVCARACRQLADWKAAGHPLPGRLAINVSAQQFDLPDFVSRLTSQLLELQADPGALELELTENSVISDPAHTVKVMDELSRMGLHIALDDFGKGYSSLTYLRQFNLHKLKIDGSFVQNMVEHDSDRAIASTIVAMARTLGLQTLGEGVETREQADLLATMGCDAVQGYFFGHPIDADTFADSWLKRTR